MDNEIEKIKELLLSNNIRRLGNIDNHQTATEVAEVLYENDYRRQRYGRWLFVCEHANRLDYECENCRNHIQTINEPDYILAYKRCPNCGAYMDGGNV